MQMTIPDTVKSIGLHAFKGCTHMIEISVSRQLTEIGKEAFPSNTVVIKR